MKVGVLGSGIVGRVLGAGLLWHGNDVMLGTRERNHRTHAFKLLVE
jgi:ketopantoate reductase